MNHDPRSGEVGGPWSQWAGPAASLRGVALGYGSFCEHGAAPVCRDELPRAEVVLIIAVRGSLTIQVGDDPAGHHAGRPLRSSIVGVGLSPVRTAHAGSLQALEIRVAATAVHALFGVPARELSGRVTELVDVWGARATELEERLTAVDCWRTRVSVLDELLSADVGAVGAVDPVMRGALQLLSSRRGDVTVHELQQHTGWSRTRLADRFRQHVGLAPKATARLLRFRHAVALMQRPGRRSLAAIALTCGYYDQAHLTREFGVLAGRTPTDYLRGLAAEGRLTGGQISKTAEAKTCHGQASESINQGA